MKIVINKCFGGFGLSDEALIELAEMKSSLLDQWDHKSRPVLNPFDKWEECKKGFKTNNWGSVLKEDIEYGISHDCDRHHPDLIYIVEKLGEEKSSGRFAKIKIVEIPDGTDFEVCEYDGNEWISEKHKTWG